MAIYPQTGIRRCNKHFSRETAYDSLRAIRRSLRMIRRVAVQIGIFVLLAFIVCNAYFSVRYLKRMQTIASLTLESSAIQAELSRVLEDFTNMETGQRGYL